MKKMYLAFLIISYFVGCMLFLLLNKFNILPNSIINIILKNKSLSIIISFLLILFFTIILKQNYYIIFLFLIGILSGILTMIINLK